MDFLLSLELWIDYVVYIKEVLLLSSFMDFISYAEFDAPMKMIY